jgi:hypothetical protein
MKGRPQKLQLRGHSLLAPEGEVLESGTATGAW